MLRFLTLCLALALGAAPAARAVTFQTLYDFSGGADGAMPYGRLAIDANGILYGVTVSGGAFGRGLIYKLDPNNPTPVTLHSFTGGADGSNPQSGLVLDAKGNLYGVTPSGGSATSCNQGCGTVYRFNAATSTLTTLYRFGGSTDGSAPFATPALLGGMLYGSTARGGSGMNCGVGGCGTLFRLAVSGKTMTILREISAADGILQNGRMVRSTSGVFYGLTAEAGPHGSGAAFSLNPATGAFAVVHGFDYHVDGSGSDADVTIRGGLIYGTERVGGPTNADDGTIFSMEPATGAVTTLYSFQGGSDGLFPTGGVVFGPKASFYGVTGQGGQSGAGVIYAITAKTLAFKTLHQFIGSDGSLPSGPLVLSGAALYGVTSGGGSGHGTIFKIVP